MTTEFLLKMLRITDTVSVKLRGPFTIPNNITTKQKTAKIRIGDTFASKHYEKQC